MSSNLALILLAPIAYLSLAVGVLMKSPRDRINQHFALFSIAVGTWTVSNGLVTAYAASPWGYLWARLAFASASIIAIAFFLFAAVFPSTKPSPPNLLKKLFLGSALVIFLCSFTALMVRETSVLDGVLKVRYGLLHPFFGVYFVGCFGYSLFFLKRKLKVLKGVQNLQVRYLFLGVLVAGLGATITNLLFPLVLRTSKFSQYGPLFGVFMIAMIAHAILRHRLMNIRLVIRESVVLLLAATAAGGVFVGLLSLMTNFVFALPRDLLLWVEVALVLLIALLFQPLRRQIHISLDRYLYREPYDYQRTIRESTRTIGSILDLKSLLNYVCEVIGRTQRPEFVSIYIKDLEGLGYTRMAARTFLGETSNLDSQSSVQTRSPLTDLLSHARACVLREDLERTSSDAASTMPEAAKQLAHLGGEVAFPIVYEEDLSGFVIIAPKLSGDPYFSEDIDLLSTLVGQASIAIKNAQLYRQVALVNEYVTNIVATMESGIIAVDTNGKITLFNPSAERITGLNRQSVASKTTGDLPTALAQPLEATLADGEPRIETETMILDTLGRYTPVSYSTHPLCDRTSNVLGAVGVFSDLTRLKELEGEKRRAERLASIGALASGIAHEIKNPLVAIKTFAELLPDRFTERDFREDFSQVVIREIARIDDLVARLRGLAVPSTRVQPRIDLREPIEETLVLLRAQLDHKRVTVKRSYEKVLPLVPGNSAQLKQLFLNIFINSLEAMNVAGQLTIHLARRENPGGFSLLAEVTDSGIGIPREIIGKAFDPFVTTKPGGSGLGLAICRGIADAHRATIEAKNNSDGPGTTVAIEFFVTEEMLTAVGS